MKVQISTMKTLYIDIDQCNVDDQCDVDEKALKQMEILITLLYNHKSSLGVIAIFRPRFGFYDST